MRILMPCAALLLAGGAEAATLRPVATLDGPVVRMSDLFDDAGQDADRVLGPGPAPGGRIVVAAAQLAAIARQFGVEWRPASSQDRAVLDRPGRMLPRETILGAFKAALANLGAGNDLEIDMPGFAAPMVPLTGAVDTAVEQLDWDGASGRFTGVLAVSGATMGMTRLRVAGTAFEMADLPVPVRRLNAGSVVAAGDLHIARVRATIANTDVVREAAQAVGMTMRHQAVAGQPLALGDLGRTALVLKGARVMMELRSAGIIVAALGQALEPGAQGERIRILNPASRAVVEAEVVGQDRVRVQPGSVPVVPAGARTAQLTNFAGPVQ